VRAAANRAVGRVSQRQDDGGYLVPSANSDHAYTLRVLDVTRLVATSTCPHGPVGDDARGWCWHRLSALAREVIRLGVKYLIRPGGRRCAR